jgi:hypothetical protein
LRQDDVPDGWQDAEFGWSEVRDLARLAWRQKMALEFMDLLAQGWRSSEAATGQLGPGAQMSAAGQVHRTQSSTPSEWRRRASVLLDAIGREPPGAVDRLLQVNVEAMANGSYGSTSGDALLSEAESTLAAYRGQRAAAQAKARADTVEIQVPQAFSAMGGQYTVGTMRVTHERLRDLNDWTVKMEQQAAQHRWPSPLGFENRPWPPFRVVQPPVAA